MSISAIGATRVRNSRQTAWRRLLGWLLACLFVLPAAAQQPTAQLQQLRAQLQQAADMGARVEAPARLSLLRGLQAPPGSAEELELLYLLASTYEAPPVSEARWAQWLQAADPNQVLLLERVRALARTERAWQMQRYREALDLLPPEAGDETPPRWRLREQMRRADVVEENGDPQAALLLRVKAMELLEQVGSPAQQALELASLAYTYARTGSLELGLKTSLEALKRLGNAPSLTLRGRVLNIHALVLSRMGRHRESREALEAALLEARRSSDQGFVATLLGNLSDAALQERNWSRALKAADEAYLLSRELNDPSATSLALHNRGIAKIRMGRVHEGKADVRHSVTLELQRGGQTSAAEGLHELGVALEEAGDMAGALQAFHEFRDLDDAQMRVDRREAIREAQAQMERNKREREQRERTLRNQTQEAQLQGERLQLWLGLLGIACGAAVLALLILLQRRLRRTNAELAVTNRDLKARSEVDPLTGLGNRRRFERMSRQLTQAGALQAGLLLVDIDHFKQINDQHGHAAGDLVLQAVAGRLRAAMRETESDGVVRWGGEEFLVLLPAADSTLVAALAQRVLADLAASPVALRDGVELKITASLGAAAFPDGVTRIVCNPERAVAIVDALMYLAKLHGRNQAWQLTGVEAETADELLALLQDVDAALAAGRLRLRRHRTEGEPA